LPWNFTQLVLQKKKLLGEVCNEGQEN
jgi:hypothetical protein